jgi:hypothetical protein
MAANAIAETDMRYGAIVPSTALSFEKGRTLASQALYLAECRIVGSPEIGRCDTQDRSSSRDRGRREGSLVDRPRTLVAVSLIATALLAVPAHTQAATCESLAGLALADTTIDAARIVPAGAFVVPADRAGQGPSLFHGYDTLPAFCRVEGTIRRTADSAIGFEVWLPASGWNGRYMGAGNGAFGGTINYDRLAEALKAGYAGSSTDTGHRSTTTSEVEWARGHPQRVVDFNDRAIHLTADRSKAIVRAFYGHRPSRSYFNSCSNGGRQAIVEAIQYPRDYDGILAGAPAFYYGRDLARQERVPYIAESVPALRAFHDRGGKLILFHGALDRPGQTIAFYEELRSMIGQRKANQFVRLYVVPEMGHCGGGPVPEFGVRVVPQADSTHSMSAALEHWVEHGVAPGAIVAAQYRVDEDPSSGIVRTRPLCPYPTESAWSGHGSRDAAANYRCAR